MNNEERDKKISETHDAVIKLTTTCAAREKQISTLFEGYDQTQKNTTALKIMTGVCLAVWGLFTSALGWVITSK